MKKLCEIYDISQEYQNPSGTILICVSEVDKKALSAMLEKINFSAEMIFDFSEWQQYLEINKLYNRNESKHQMREIRQSKRVESDTLMRYETDTIAEILNNAELQSKIEMALLTLSPLPKRRFLKHYLEHLTYREIAEEECKAVSTIYESIMTARKKFLKNFE